jgi:hypothetical protein
MPELVAPQFETDIGPRRGHRLDPSAVGMDHVPAGGNKPPLDLLGCDAGVHRGGLGRLAEPVQQQRCIGSGCTRDAGDVGGPLVFRQGVEAAEIQQQRVTVTHIELAQPGDITKDEPRRDARANRPSAGGGQAWARGLPDLMNYLHSQMRKGQLRQMDPVVALQLLAGPIVVHLLTRPLAQALTDFDTPQSQVLDDIVHAWLRAMAPQRRRSPTVDSNAEAHLVMQTTGALANETLQEFGGSRAGPSWPPMTHHRLALAIHHAPKTDMGGGGVLRLR